MAKLNCWEVKKCGREVGGSKVGEFGVCPAAVQEQLNGCNGGKNGGRACWVVAGTLCGGKVQGSFAQKEKNCLGCEFYLQVQDEEGENYIDSSTLRDKLN